MFLIGYKIVTCAYCEAKTPINHRIWLLKLHIYVKKIVNFWCVCIAIGVSLLTMIFGKVHFDFMITYFRITNKAICSNIFNIFYIGPSDNRIIIKNYVVI